MAIRERLLSWWHCNDHSLPDKPAACWKDADQSGVCFPLTIRNINYWISRIVSYFNWPRPTMYSIVYIDLGPCRIFGECETITAQSWAFLPRNSFTTLPEQHSSAASYAHAYALSILSATTLALSTTVLASGSTTTFACNQWTCSWMSYNGQRTSHLLLASILR